MQRGNRGPRRSDRSRAGLYFKSWWGAVGVVPLMTGALRWCPAYLPFRIDTSAK